MKSLNVRIRMFCIYYEKLMRRGFMLLLAVSCFQVTVLSQSIDVSKRLEGFDSYMDKALKDWNIAGACVGIVYKDKLIYAKGYGYRDYEA